MPPFTIDPKELWEAISRLANENDHSWRFTKKGDRRPRYDVEATMETKKRNKAKKQQAATERALAAARIRNLRRAAPGQGIADRMLRAMRPGQWYGQGDLMRLAGTDRSGRSKVAVLVKRAWIEKAKNPAWQGRQVSPQEIAAGVEPEPQHLYRLTVTGEAAREALSSG